jgi:hypothetical protein
MLNNRFGDSVEHSFVDLELMPGMRLMMGREMTEIELLVVGIGVADSVADKDFGVQD